MPEIKYDKFLVTLRPQCGLLPSEVELVLGWVSSLGCAYYCAIENAHLGPQATHVHALLKFGVPRRKSNLVRDIWKKCLGTRIKGSIQHGFDVRHVPETSYLFHLGYLQKEFCVKNQSAKISEDQLKKAYAHWLVEEKKSNKGKKFGCLPMKTSNYMSFIRDERIRSLEPDPYKNFKKLLETDKYTIPFANKPQQLEVERLNALGQPMPMDLVRHILGGCSVKCDTCKLHTHMKPCTCWENISNDCYLQRMEGQADVNCVHADCAHMIR